MKMTAARTRGTKIRGASPVQQTEARASRRGRSRPLIWRCALGSCTWWCVVAVDVLTHAPCVVSRSQRCPTPVNCPPRAMVSRSQRCPTPLPPPPPATCPPRGILVVPSRLSFSSWLLWCASRDWRAVREAEHLRWIFSKVLYNSNNIVNVLRH